MIFQDEKDFWKFRKENEHLRFWEAVKEYSGVDSITVQVGEMRHDTKYYQDVKIVK